MITIYAEHITTRLTYVLDFCFKQKGIDYKIVTTVTEWNSQKRKDINYSYQELEAGVKVYPQGILYESDIYQSKKIELGKEGLEIDGVYDPFGLIFYLLSCYEAYYSENTDQHGRLFSQASCLVKNNLNKVAVVDRIVLSLWSQLNQKYTKETYRFVPSFDIDVAWAYKNRNFIRSMGGFAKGKKWMERSQVLMGLKKDPYDTYDEMRKIEEKSDDLKTFILLGDWDKFDKNIHWEHPAYQALIQQLSEKNRAGIHPSYASYLDASKVTIEKERLEKILGTKVEDSRQHFLRLKIPTSYQLLNQIGIKNDYSMGFADNVGFRAGTSFAFPFFDLENNLVTELWIHPFAYMDSALKDYLNMSPQKAKVIVKKLLDEVKMVGGKFMCIWHNSSIHDQGEWKGWKSVLDFTVDQGAKSNGNEV